MHYFLLFLIVSFSFSESLVDGIAVVVDKNIVLHSDILQQTQFAAIERGIDPSRSPYLFEDL